jgi:TolB protein
MNHPCPARSRPAPSQRFLTLRGGLAVILGLNCLPFPAVGLNAAQPGPLGHWQAHRDIGQTVVPGAATFDPVSDAYRVTGGGENMWFDRDAFHFAWRELSGDIAIAADIQWPVPGGNPHRKAGLMIRQSLDPGSPYVDVILHGDGLTSLQFRESPGGPTREIQGRFRHPTRLRLERHGDFFTWLTGADDSSLERPGGCVQLAFTDPVYVGLAVCSHDATRLEQAVFSRVVLRSTPSPRAAVTAVESTLETITIASRDRRAVYHTDRHIEAPNWSPDGTYLLYNSQGRIWRYALAGGPPVQLNTGFANRCNNDHGISPDGQTLAISDQSETGQSLIYILPLLGGTPRRVTQLAPSYWHGWAPDGKSLVYCAERDGEYDVYSIPVTGGAETRLTTAPGLDDGPEFSPDGRYIFFNSERTGRMQIWRMNPDGSEQTQITFDAYNDWFPHPSPDGQWIVFLSYGPEVKGHPANQDVRLRLMPAAGGEIQVLARLFGGQGTINVPSWSPDSRQLAFVSYCPVFPRTP